VVVFVKPLLKLCVVFLFNFYKGQFILKCQGDLFVFYHHLIDVFKLLFNNDYYKILLSSIFFFQLSTPVSFYAILLIHWACSCL